MNKLLSSIFFCLLLASPVFLSSCSEENDEEDEYANWQERNDAQTDQWAAGASSGTYRKILTYAKSESASSLANSDYIYVEEVEKGSGMESPIYTDNVRVAYRGRYIPTKSYPEGYVFDQTFLGNFDWKTANMIDASPEGLVEGFSTALMHMHEGDRWIVHIPYQLGYGTSTSAGIRAYSDLTFDIDFRFFCVYLPHKNQRLCKSMLTISEG